MEVKNATAADIRDALRATNISYAGNLRFNRKPEQYRGGVRFTLAVRDSRGEGSRKSHRGRRMACACWHAHGELFDHLLSINPDAIIQSAGRTITAEGGNWHDWEIGSIVDPMMASDACDC